MRILSNEFGGLFWAVQVPEEEVFFVFYTGHGQWQFEILKVWNEMTGIKHCWLKHLSKHYIHKIEVLRLFIALNPVSLCQA